MADRPFAWASCKIATTAARILAGSLRSDIAPSIAAVTASASKISSAGQINCPAADGMTERRGFCSESSAKGSWGGVNKDDLPVLQSHYGKAAFNRAIG